MDVDDKITAEREWARRVSDAAIQAHGGREYIAIAAWMEAFCAGIDWYIRSYDHRAEIARIIKEEKQKV